MIEKNASNMCRSTSVVKRTILCIERFFSSDKMVCFFILDPFNCWE